MFSLLYRAVFLASNFSAQFNLHIALTGGGIGLGLGLDFKSIKKCGFDRIFQSILRAGIETQNSEWIFGFYATMGMEI